MTSLIILVAYLYSAAAPFRHLTHAKSIYYFAPIYPAGGGWEQATKTKLEEIYIPEI